MTEASALTASGALGHHAPRAPSWHRMLALALFVITALSAVGLLAGVVTMPAELSSDFESSVAASLMAVGMAALSLAGTLLIHQQPRSVIAWLMVATALGWVASHAAILAAWLLLDAGHPAGVITG